MREVCGCGDCGNGFLWCCDGLLHLGEEMMMTFHTNMTAEKGESTRGSP